MTARHQATIPDLEPPDPAFREQLELADLTERLAERLERLRHVVARRLAQEGRALAGSLRRFGVDRAALIDDVLTFQARARDLLSGSR